MSYGMLRDKLSVTKIHPSLRANTAGNYRYLVLCGMMNHVAFRNREALERWLDERGLKLTREINDAEDYEYIPVEGAYYDCGSGDVERFNANYNAPDAVKIKRMSNGSFTIGYISVAEDGNCVENYLGPNSERVELDYFETMNELDPWD